MVPVDCSMMDDMVCHHGLFIGPLNSGVVLTAYPLSGCPICESDGRPITSDDVRRAEYDEDIRHLEMMGLARRKGGKLATLDAALHVLWPQSTLLIPV